MWCRVRLEDFVMILDRCKPCNLLTSLRFFDSNVNSRVANLNRDDVLWAGRLCSLETLAKLRDFLILPDYNTKQIENVRSAFLLRSTAWNRAWKVGILSMSLYLRCKSKCSCSSWFSRVWEETAESWFWIFCFSSLISSFKELIVWEQIAEVNPCEIRDMTRLQMQ